MDLFVAHFSNRVDAKGRVSIPASYRAVLARDGFEGLFVTPSLDADALDCGGNSLLREIAELIERQPPYSPERDLFSTALYGRSETLKVDGEGRMVLSDAIRDHARISNEVTFVGQGQKFQIWEPSRFRAHLEEATLRLRDLRKQLGSRDAAGGTLPTPRPPGARE